MPDDTYPNDEDIEVYDDNEEYVDFDDHEHARAYERRKRVREEQERQRHDDFPDEYLYGEESGEVYEEKDDR